MVVDKYGKINKWEPLRILDFQGVSLWKGVMAIFQHFRDATFIDAGNGSNTLFWEDR